MPPNCKKWQNSNRLVKLACDHLRGPPQLVHGCHHSCGHHYRQISVDFGLQIVKMLLNKFFYCESNYTLKFNKVNPIVNMGKQCSLLVLVSSCGLLAAWFVLQCFYRQTQVLLGRIYKVSWATPNPHVS